MAWIELHQSLWTHRKTLTLSAILEIDELYAAAHMAKLWTWALDNAPDGDISSLPPKVIAYGAGWKGDAEKFLESLIFCCWVDQTKEKTVLHDWYDYAGRLLEKKNANKERMKSKRASHVHRTNKEQTANVDNTCDEQPSHVQGLPNLTLPNHTIPNNSESILGENPHQERLRILANTLGIKGMGIDGLETIYSYVGQVDVEVIEKAMKKAEGRHVNYFVQVINGFISEGKTTKDSIDNIPKSGDNKHGTNWGNTENPYAGIDLGF